MKPIKRRKAYTTGQAARLLDCATRTVAAWIDRGDLEGYRLPGSRDRRVLHGSLVEFMRDTLGMPVPPELGEPPLATDPRPAPPPALPKDEPVLLESRGVARLLSCSVRTVWRLAKSGGLPAPVRLGGKYARWFRAEVLAWLADRRAAVRQDILAARANGGQG
jgi:excisionase family DNA binding protein